MANVTTGSHLYFDSTGSVKGRLKIIWLAWVGISANEIADDDDLSITDTDGNVIAAKRATAIGDDLGICPSSPLEVDGLSVATLDGGVVLVWLEDPIYNSGPAYLK